MGLKITNAVTVTMFAIISYHLEAPSFTQSDVLFSFAVDLRHKSGVGGGRGL